MGKEKEKEFSSPFLIDSIMSYHSIMKSNHYLLYFILQGFTLFIWSDAFSRHPLIQYYDGEKKLTLIEVDSLVNQVITNKPSSYLLSLAFYQKGVLHRKKGEDIDAFESYVSSLEYLQKADTNDHYLMSAVLRNQGVILHNYKLYKEAVNRYQKALEPAYQYSKARGVSTEYNIGFSMIKYDPENALKLLLDLIDKIRDDSSRIARVYNQIGLFEKRVENYEEAIRYLSQGLDLEVTGRVRANLLQSLSDTYYHQQDYLNQEKFLLQALEIPEANKFIAWMDLGECYLLQGRNEEAKAFLEQAKSIYDDQPLKKEHIKVFKWLQKLSDSPMIYAEKQIEEQAKYIERMDLLKEMMGQLALKNILLATKADKKRKEDTRFYQLLAVLVIILSIAIYFTWKTWWKRRLRRIKKQVSKIMNELEP